MRIQDLTPLESIGAEGESSRAVKSGDKHKITHMVTLQFRNGDQVPMIQTVWRHPPYGEFTCFILQLHQIGMTDQEMQAINKKFEEQESRFQTLFNALMQRVERAEKYRDELERHHMDHHREESHHGHHEHDQKTSVTIGTASTAWIVAILIPLIGMLGYLAYLVAWPNHQGGAKPPEIHAPLP